MVFLEFMRYCIHKTYSAQSFEYEESGDVHDTPSPNIEIKDKHRMVVTWEKDRGSLIRLIKKCIEQSRVWVQLSVQSREDEEEDEHEEIIITHCDDDDDKSLQGRLMSLVRYSLINCIPTYAIGNVSKTDDEYVHDDGYTPVNTSQSTTTEEITARVQLIPLKVNSNRDVLNSYMEVKYKNDGDSPIYVKSKDLKDPRNCLAVEDGNFRIALLYPEEEIHLRFAIEKGTGCTHSKFQITSQVRTFEEGESFKISYNVIGRQLTKKECFQAAKRYIEDQTYISIQRLIIGNERIAIATTDPCTWWRSPPGRDDSSPDEAEKENEEEEVDYSGNKRKRGDDWNEIHKELLKKKVSFGRIPPQKRNKKRNGVNPFQLIDNIKRTGRSSARKFFDRAVNKLIEMDCTWNLISSAITNSGSQVVLDIASAPGSWSQYVIDKYEALYVYGFTLQDENAEGFRPDLSNTQRFEDLSQKVGRGNGDVIENRNTGKKLIRQLRSRAAFVMCDGGLINHAENQVEKNTEDLIRGEIRAALNCLEPGGSMVCKLFMTTTTYMKRLLFITAKMFEKILITKPLGSRPTNSERYFVGVNFRGIATDENEKKIINKKEKDENCLVYATEATKGQKELYASFDTYLTESSVVMAKNQIEALDSVLLERKDISPEEQESNLQKCMDWWEQTSNMDGVAADNTPLVED